MEQRLYEALQRNPIIAAVRDDEGLAQCLRTDIQTVFVLYGDICNISEIVRQIKDAGKIAIVHADLISGLAAKEISVDFLRRSTQADGVISTRANMIQRAKELNMIAILRVFLIDSMALDSALSAKNLKPDAIDILPGLMPSMLRKVRQLTGLPILTGGLITEKKEVMQALEAGHFQYGPRRMADVRRNRICAPIQRAGSPRLLNRCCRQGRSARSRCSA